MLKKEMAVPVLSIPHSSCLSRCSHSSTFLHADNMYACSPSAGSRRGHKYGVAQRRKNPPRLCFAARAVEGVVACLALSLASTRPMPGASTPPSHAGVGWGVKSPLPRTPLICVKSIGRGKGAVARVSWCRRWGWVKGRDVSALSFERREMMQQILQTCRRTSLCAGQIGGGNN